MLMVILLTSAAAQFLTPLWASFIHTLDNEDIRTAGIAIAVSSWVIGLTCIPISKLQTKFFTPTTWLCAGLLVLSACYFCYGLVHTAFELYLIQSILGLALSVQYPACDTLFTLGATDQNLTVAWGSYTALMYIGMGLGALIGSHLSHHFGFKVVFSIMGTIPLLLIIFIFVVRDQLQVSKN